MPHRISIFCDESIKSGKYFSNFYGGVLLNESDLETINPLLEAKKQELNLHGEVKFTKITDNYKNKYIELIQTFFEFIADGRVKTRIMFTQNINEPMNLSKEQIDSGYFRLYHQLIKHAFGLQYADGDEQIILRLNFDHMPGSREQVAQFKSFLQGLEKNPEFRSRGILIPAQNISEIDSHKHNILQCLDIILGCMQFKLNGKDKEKPPGKHFRGKTTRAKEDVYKAVRAEICKLYPNYSFNAGVTTCVDSSLQFRWSAPYSHWLLEPKNSRRNPQYQSKSK